MNDTSVYLSYCSSYSACLALALFHALRAAGCDVFIDTSASDDRDAVDLAQIGARAHFLVILTPALVDALQDPEDPTYQEIRQAVRARRDVVPLLANGFSFGAAQLTQEISVLRSYHVMPLTPENLADTARTLVEQRFNTRIFGRIAPTPPEQAETVQQRIAEAARQSVPTTDELRAEVLYNRALARNRQDYAGKLTDLNEVLRLNPGHVHARFDRAVARRRSGDESGAVADYDEILRLNPQFYKAYNNRAELYFAHAAYLRALADYERATALHPNYTMALAGKALTLHALGRLDEALALWRPLAAHDDRFNDAIWVGRELRLPTAMIDEIHRLTQRLHMPPYPPEA